MRGIYSSKVQILFLSASKESTSTSAKKGPESLKVVQTPFIIGFY